MTRLRTVAARLDEARLLVDPATHWRATEAIDHAGPAVPDAADPLLDALATAAAVRVTARLAAGDDRAARHAAVEGATMLDTLTDRLRPAEAALRATSATPGTSAWREAFAVTRQASQAMADHARARVVAAGSTALLLNRLDLRGVAGRDWLAAARDEDDAPFLFMPADAAPAAS